MGNTLQVTRAREKKSRITLSYELLEQIFIRIADGESLNKICSQDDMPSRNAFFMWIREDETILQAYELALLTRADFYLDEIVDIADDENVKLLRILLGQSYELMLGNGLHQSWLQRNTGIIRSLM